MTWCWGWRCRCSLKSPSCAPPRGEFEEEFGLKPLHKTDDDSLDALIVHNDDDDDVFKDEPRKPTCAKVCPQRVPIWSTANALS